ncbi:hypothetical protein ADK34_26720 [Streptomyces viridochromogenes]|uniref:Uncharacterized protein n=1 Tax=Streptomyces viridochromogenes TaxID=1938 RepID=A0A0L8JQB6_STRVR|nr:hypothetical protein ADK34_26720 [Streptomyces viridochromogenes]
MTARRRPDGQERTEEVGDGGDGLGWFGAVVGHARWPGVPGQGKAAAGQGRFGCGVAQALGVRVQRGDERRALAGGAQRARWSSIP